MNGQVLEENPTVLNWEDEATDKTHSSGICENEVFLFILKHRNKCEWTHNVTCITNQILSKIGFCEIKQIGWCQIRKMIACMWNIRKRYVNLVPKHKHRRQMYSYHRGGRDGVKDKLGGWD